PARARAPVTGETPPAASAGTGFVRACRPAAGRRSSSAGAPRGGSASPPELCAVERRQRLSRSRDFDAVYRQGRSVSTRSLTLHWFARDEEAEGVPRLGLPIPRAVGAAVAPTRLKTQRAVARGVGSSVARNRLKRQLGALWVELGTDVPSGRDYVLAARPGLAEAA